MTGAHNVNQWHCRKPPRLVDYRKSLMEMLYRSSPLDFSVVNSCKKTVTELSNMTLAVLSGWARRIPG